MITGIFETHLNVTDLERSHHFYETVLGLPHAYGQKERGNSFYWIGGKGNAMLGLWQRNLPKCGVSTLLFMYLWRI